jgi:2-haloacid dehalogenase
MKPQVLVFDVNETLVDIGWLEPLFARLFDDKQVMREWFAQLILYSEAITLSGLYATFGQLGVGALRMIGNTHGVPIADSDADELRSRMRSMPAHRDVEPALRRLRDAGFRLVTLTNSAPDPQGSVLQRAGLDHYFERFFSVHEVRRFKPAPEVYRLVAGSLGIELSAMCLIAAHTWDTIGAQAVGCTAALITRPGNAALPVEGVPQPDIVAADLASTADEIIRRWR